MQQPRGQKKSTQDDILMFFLMHAILWQRLDTPGNMHLSDHCRDMVQGWPNINAPSLSIVNLDEVSLFYSGHWPKMFLFLLEEMAYVYTRIGAEDVDGLQVMAYEVLAMTEMRYRLHKRSTNPQDMMQGDAMSRVILGDLSRLKRLVWAMFDGFLVAGAPPKLRPDESWEWVVHGIFNKLIYIGRNPSDQCPMMTVGVKDLQGPGIQAEVPTKHSHHQGSEPAWSINSFGGTPRTSGVPKEVGHRGLFRLGQRRG